ncbi:hypothetical protein TIFTF001_043293 [Ficus carica]|uniref:Uncharacterized protein n=1 Tax=Ficus carica TaxID=3494 RepID=A0AA87YYC1_FICCA|nr:hypothetical protein TIFTF001_043283 [Ficus carica]GMN21335.1 hypothetical protein TIFTF001_043285 [Ficus carica]GMN21341.1 hypothetical protein TIFTF001_043291 [Ficus carica]GMN21365.1 hypothetical protein TIFTF001_043293 [Ficus carica]
MVYIHIYPSDTVSARSSLKGRRSWTSLGNPNRPLISDKSSSVKTERGFDVRKNDSTLKRRGGLVNRAIGGIDKTSAPDVVAGQLLSNASLLVPVFVLLCSNSYSNLERRMVDASSSSLELLSLESVLVHSTSTSSIICFSYPWVYKPNPG